MECFEIDRFWAVFCGAEGEDPKLVALLAKKERAEEYIALHRPGGEPGELLVFDPVIDVAVLHEGAVWIANNYEIDTHEQLLAGLERPR